MSEKESDDEMHDADEAVPAAMPNGNVNVPGSESVAAGVAAGNIHLQSADAATLALPEVGLTLPQAC